jgi:DNA-binding MarR family transcriptional regulator
VSEEPDVEQVAAAVRITVGLLVRRLRQLPADGELTLPEGGALAQLERAGPSTASELARLEQISPQSMGATLGSLEARGLVQRAPDPQDGRRVILSVTDGGLELLQRRRSARTDRLARALATEFNRSELERLASAAPLLERLAQSI